MMTFPGVLQRLIVICFFLTISVLASIAQEDAASLSLEDVEEARRLILSNQVDFKARVDLAKRLSILFEQIGRPETARRLTLEFISSANAQFQSNTAPAASSSEWAKIAETIHTGKYLTAVKTLQAELKKNASVPANPAAMVLALKSDDMLTAYHLLYGELSSGVRSAYADYFLSILAAREKRVTEASQLMQQAEGKLAPDRLNQWVAMDRAKLATVLNEFDEAERLLKSLIKESPNDPHVLYLYLLLDFARGQKDQAGRRLTQLIPKLQADPYLLAQAATLAVRLNETDAAARMLETHEANIEANRDFYEAFALVKKAQGKASESDAYLAKANQLKETRVAVETRGEQERLLGQALASARQSSGPSSAEMEGITPVSKAYLYLLENNPSAAESALQERIQSKQAEPTEYIILQTVQRRMEKLSEAKATLARLQKAYPEFQPYYVLTHLADYAIRTNDAKTAKSSYQELIKKFPKSNQAVAAAGWLKKNQLNSSAIIPIKTSPLLTRYPQYGAAFALSEIINYWDESTTFAKVSSAIGVSAQRGIQFHELIPVILNGAKFEINPVAPTFDAIASILSSRVPVMYCLGEMFGNQQLESVLLLVGFDPVRRVVYAEGIRGDDPHVLTENELSTGIALALHPGTVKMPQDDKIESALTLGADQVRLNLDAIKLMRMEIETSEPFNQQMASVASQTGPEYVPMQMAYARWLVRPGQEKAPQTYLKQIQNNCAQIGEYHFLRAHYHFSQKNYAQALKSIQTAISLQPQHPRWTLALARILYTQGQVDEAIQTCEEVCKQHPENLTAAAYLLSLYKRTGNTEKLQQEAQRLKDALNVETLPFDETADEKMN
ncbi:MAG: tetratricopeptide repeat protein [Candidatus Hinthialibacter antarcticus]|nr:tetratricopeptide repeat protein [Candidatus Hinthialibacter antarcticus]